MVGLTVLGMFLLGLGGDEARLFFRYERTLVFDGEPFFGQDRIAMAKWRMEQKGLAER